MQAHETDDDEESYSDDDEDYEDDHGFVELPPVVKTEIARRKQLLKEGEDISIPVNPVAVKALRHHFEYGGGKPYFHGSYISLMEKLGAKLSSTDPLVKDSRYNIFYLGPTGEDSAEFWRAQTEKHEAEVRLIRYGEFLEQQEAKGLVLDEHCKFENDYVEESYYVLRVNDDNEDYRKDTSGIADDDLTRDQLEALIMSFTNGYYSYCNFDKIKAGLAEGITGSLQGTGSTRYQKFEIDGGVIIDQCRELYDRYMSQGRPLPGAMPDEPRSSSANKNKNRKKNKKDLHAETITGHLHDLCLALEKHFTTPTIPSAHFLYEFVQLWLAAVSADPDVARAFARESDGKLILRLRERSLEFAKSADADPSRSSYAADSWWKVFGILTELAGDIIGTLTSLWDENHFEDSNTPDDLLAGEFFESTVAPALLESAASPLAAERGPSLKALCRAACGVPRDRSISLVRDKAKWKVLEAACSLPPCVTEGSPYAQMREDCFAPRAAREATRLLTGLCGRGMTLDKSPGAKTPVVPGHLARKMIQRGIVPILMSLSRSPIDRVGTETITGLGQISRVKDCRQILFQEPGGVQLVQDMLASSNGEKVSNAMLLAVHLLWDEEWREPLLSIQPRIETIAVKWAGYGMKLLRAEAVRIREESDRKSKENDIKFMKRYSLPDGSLEKERLELEMNEVKAALENEVKWFELETEKARGNPANSAISRSIMLLNTMLHNKDAPARLMSVNSVALAAACLDIPIEDTHSGAATFLRNFSVFATLSTLLFPDPDHVLYSLISRMNQYADQQLGNQQAAIIAQLLTFLRRESDWAPVFDNLAKRDDEAKFFIEQILPRFMTREVAGKPQPAPRAMGTLEQRGIHEGCAKPTGKLRTCEKCGKMEGKKGQLRACSKCHVVVYCGRDCQVEDWKRHKKECAKLAKEKK